MFRDLTTSVLGGLVAGVLDLGYAFTVWGIQGVSPVAILHSIASGLYGREAYSGGPGMAAVGAVLHFVIATAMAAGFVTLTRLRPDLLQHPTAAGAIYGLILFAAMNFVVVPLSAAPVTFPAGWLLAGALFAHTILVGIPIALIVRRAAKW